MKRTIIMLAFVLSLSMVLAGYVEYESLDEHRNYDEITMHGVTLTSEGYQDYTAVMHLDQGWNLVKGPDAYSEDYLMPDSQLSLDDIGAVFTFLPASKQYLPIFPHTDQNRQRQMEIVDRILPEEAESTKTTAQWVYAREPGILKMDAYIFYDVFPLWQGWNLISLNPFNEGHSINDFVGNCNILRTYEFSNNEWVAWDLDKDVAAQDLGKGLAIKAENNCVLAQAENIVPPALPN